MAIINGNGISQATSVANGQGNRDVGGQGLVSSESGVLAYGNRDIGGAAIASAAVVPFGAIVTLAKIVSIVAVTSTRVRVTFDRGMKKDSALQAPFNYAMVPITGGAAPVAVNEIETPSGTSIPDNVDMLISEMTDGATYEVTVNDGAGGPTDPVGTPMDPANNSDQFLGIGEAPEVKQVIAQSLNRVDVVFTETMKSTPEILDPARYLWDNGLSTVSILELDGDTVKLVTNDQVPGVLYNLTITP